MNMIGFLRRFRDSPWYKRIVEVRGLNVFFASLCVIDLFGVFPIVALPGALISCGMCVLFLTKTVSTVVVRHFQVTMEFRCLYLF